MPIPILMPALSPTMTEGNLAKWHKKEGDTVKAGDVLAEIETDKATMEVEAVDEGRIGRILVAEGTQAVKVNTEIAILLEEDEEDSALDGGAPAKKAEPAKAQPAPAAQAAPAKAEPAPAKPAAAAAKASDERISASPLARRMAAQAGVDLAGISGSGPNGRIVKSDIEGALGKAPATPAQAASPAAAAAAPAAAAAKPAPAPVAAAAPAAGKDHIALLAGGIPYRLDPHTSMRKTIARRLSESKQQVPHFYLSVDCTIDRLLATRKELNGRSDAYKLSVNDFVIRASALALRKVPQANASWSDDGILFWEQVDVSVAVAIPNGLITPIIKKADQKGLAAISDEMRDLATRAKDGKLKPDEFQGGTFSVSNLGMFGIPTFSAIINPPQACILAVGAGEQRPVVKDGALAIATQMTCTLSVDHRVVDGAVGARFLSAFKGYIEDPLSMLL
ncbi:pyruvate dehydrogenase E2 component (dihydrolipoamide acetyltransferase) [Stella humosa]|uniref:Acetyltransferase component of pyruvate dehydrogenase complex n=1 Tax=Stella humosa TaxID=94 RepID=A0A3N1MCY1_9PROT|nr:pyruvate dehydrogenase complex dihydrolipoamide acetyltransferase [Stella humosa]ROQ01563.1 pyruvate dehydrogenase E2 component (dihydrolipoamide acetyltransferase) [Stella humosa]BBK31943.1 acetyltransferase component of pyruvate dehydrogenase complex [Stella humosa]